MNYYEVLGINQDATQSEIKQAYRRLTLKTHPDKNNNGSDSEFKKLTEAFETLYNIDKRMNYDAFSMRNKGKNISNSLMKVQKKQFIINNEENLNQDSDNDNDNNHYEVNNSNKRKINNFVEPIRKTLVISLEESYNGCCTPLNIERKVGNLFENELFYVNIPAGTDKGEDPKVVMTTEAEEEDKEATDEVIDLEEILREMEADMKKDDEVNEDDAHDPAKAGEAGELRAELKEAYSTIKSLQSTINEVNLLNAKLLFANKLFRAHNMTNEQKVKVIETLDRTKSVREVKLVYATLAENLKPVTTSNKVAKKSISEGLASKVVKSTKPAAPAQKQVIAESADFADRFRKLAGIIK